MLIARRDSRLQSVNDAGSYVTVGSTGAQMLRNLSDGLLRCSAMLSWDMKLKKKSIILFCNALSVVETSLT